MTNEALKARLRQLSGNTGKMTWVGNQPMTASDALTKAADAIERLEADNARLREALEPFSQLFLYPDDFGFEHSEYIRGDEDWDEYANDMCTQEVFVLRRDIKKARAALEKQHD